MDIPTNYFSGMGSGDAAILGAMASRGGDGFGGGGMGAGLGAGLLGGLLGSQLFRRGGLGGDGVDGGVVTPAFLAASQAEQTAALNNTSVMASLGDIKAAVPLAEAQVQLALSGTEGNLTNAINSSTNMLGSQLGGSTQTLLANQAMITKNIFDSTMALSQSLAGVKETVNTTSTMNMIATRDDGDKTRAAIAALAQDINANNIATLNRQLATAEAALLEQRSLSRTREVEVNVAQTVNQAQAQSQAQSQFQIQNDLLRTILAHAQVAQATNANLIIGNSGMTSTGPQTANPVNVR